MMKKVKERMNYGKKSGTIILLCILMGVFVGCNSNTKEIPEESVAEIASETLSTSEISEMAVEESSSEEIESEEPEITDGVQMVYYENIDEFEEYVYSLDSTVLLGYSFHHPGTIASGQAIVFDGAHYTWRKGAGANITSYKPIESVTSLSDLVEVEKNLIAENKWNLEIDGVHTDIEVPLKVIYEDGTEEKITFFITKDWYGIGEEGYNPTETKLEVEGDAELVSYNNFDNQDAILDYLKEVGTDKTAIAVETEYGEQLAILYEGAHCYINEDVSMLIPDDEIRDIDGPDGLITFHPEDAGFYRMWPERNLAADMEIPLNISYKDGTQETITIYLHYDKL